jgi:hypothetical protein
LNEEERYVKIILSSMLDVLTFDISSFDGTKDDKGDDDAVGMGCQDEVSDDDPIPIHVRLISPSENGTSSALKEFASSLSEEHERGMSMSYRAYHSYHSYEL